DGGTGSFKNTIVSNNIFGGLPSNCGGAGISSLGNNLESGIDCGFTAGGDIQNVDPQLGRLQNNGGPTDTRALPAATPAVDRGSSDCPPPAIEQRGSTRAQGRGCDIRGHERV